MNGVLHRLRDIPGWLKGFDDATDGFWLSTKLLVFDNASWMRHNLQLIFLHVQTILDKTSFGSSDDET